MSHHHHRSHHGGFGSSGRLHYEDDGEDYLERDHDLGYDRDYETDRWRERRDGSRSPRERSHYDSSRHDSWDRRSGDRLSPPHRRLERSRSPYYASNDPRPRRGSLSRSVSPDPRYYRRSPRDHERSGRRQYYDRDAPDHYDNERAPYPGQPSRDVMLEGINGDMADDDIQNEIESHEIEGLNTVTVIRERKTGISRGFAFARFREISDAKRFLERFYPSINIAGSRVSIQYAKERNDASAADDWHCSVCLLSNFPRRSVCYRCRTSRADSEATGPLLTSAPNHFSNDGSKDAGETPSQFLSIRELEANVTEELLLKGAQKLASDESAIKRILLIRDRRTNESWRFGFVEFSTVDEAKRAFEKYTAMDGGFTIKSRPVTVSYIHPGVFVPMIQTKPGSDRWTFEPLGGMGGGVKLAYWDEEGYCKVHFAETARRDDKKEDKEPSKDGAKTKRKPEKKSDKGPPEAIAAEKTKKRKVDNISGKEITNVAPKKLPSHLQFWQERHSELHGKELADDAPEVASKGIEEQHADAPPARSYADPKRLCCYLCSRQFKTEAEVNKHERISKLHQTNLKDEKLVRIAEGKLKKHDIRPENEGIDDDEEGNSYRDRAKERRLFHSQPANPGAAKGQQKAKEALAARASPEKEIKAPISRGANLLSKMGWTEGSGLGAQGTGITAPIVAGMYVEGVGLGASGGKVGDVVDGAPGDVGGYSGFVQRTKEKARGRYEELDSKEQQA